VQPENLDLVGKTIGEYEIVSKIGSGGMGVVYEGRHPLIGKRVAVKILLAQSTSDPSLGARFLSEARAVNAIHHRGIVDIFSFGQLPSGYHYFVMEHLNGTPFDLLIRRSAPVSVAEAFGWMDEVLDALQAAHDAGIIHRDIKPSNLFLVETGRGRPYVKLLDFGIAKQVVAADQSSHTKSGMIVGTPEVMAPEQVRGEVVTPASDIYAIGCVLFELLTGRRVFEGDNLLQMVWRHVEDKPSAPSSINPQLPADVDDVILWALEKDPKNRPQSAMQLQRRMRATLAKIDTQSFSKAGLFSAASAPTSSLALGDGNIEPTAESPARNPPRTSTDENLRPIVLSGFGPSQTVEAARLDEGANATLEDRPKGFGRNEKSLETEAHGSSSEEATSVDIPLSALQRNRPARALMIGVGVVLLAGGLLYAGWPRESAPAAGDAAPIVPMVRREIPSTGSKDEPASTRGDVPEAPPSAATAPAVAGEPGVATKPAVGSEPSTAINPTVADKPSKLARPPVGEKPTAAPKPAGTDPRAAPTASTRQLDSKGANVGRAPTSAQLDARLRRLESRLAAKEARARKVDSVLRHLMTEGRKEVAGATSESERRAATLFLDELESQLR
jgi:serine/threonine-protein kinase